VHRLPLIVLALLLAAPPALAGDGADEHAIYGPRVLTRNAATLLGHRLDAGPSYGLFPTWFGDGRWLVDERTGLLLLGAPPPTGCQEAERVAPDVWREGLEGGVAFAEQKHWKAARASLDGLLLDPECVAGGAGPRSLVHAALLALARAAWHGYPEDETLARAALQAAVRLAPEHSWPHPGESELETAYLEERDELVHRPRGRLVIAAPDRTVRVDGEVVSRDVELVPGRHLVQVDGPVRVSHVLEVPDGAEIVIGSPAAVWALMVDHSGDPAARAAWHDGRDYWLLHNKRAARVDHRGGVTWPAVLPRFVLGGAVGYRFHARATTAPRVVSQAHTSHWFEPRVTVGLVGTAGTRGPMLGLLGSGSLLLAGPVDLGRYGKATRLMPTARLGGVVGTAGGDVRVRVQAYGELLFAGSQVVQIAADDSLVTRATVFIGGGAEVQGAFRLGRFAWLTVQGGGGWAASPTFTAGAGLELRLWSERR